MSDQPDSCFDLPSSLKPKQSSNNNEKDNDKEKDKDVNRNSRPSQDIDLLLLECQSYINWICNHITMTEENMRRQVDRIQRKYIIPTEKFEFEWTMQHNAFEHISNLGALCFYQIELNEFEEALMTIDRTRDFVIPCIKQGSLPIEYVDSFDYVWVFIRLHASVKEWESTMKRKFFPEIELTNIPKSFDTLSPKVKAGVYGLKAYFYELQRVSIDKQIEVLRQAISSDKSYFAWHYCLQQALRKKRRDSPPTGNQIRNYPWEDEIREVIMANRLAPSNPLAMVANIQLLAEITKTLVKEPKWNFLKFGDIKFQSMITVKSYLQEQTSQILGLVPKSVRLSTELADIFSTHLPIVHRNYILAKECLDRIISIHPKSMMANYRMAMFYLTVEFNYNLAEEYFEKANKLDDRYYQAVVHLLCLYMRKMATRLDDIEEKVIEQMGKPFWDKKQLGGLHYLKGLLLSSGQPSKAKLAVDDFIKAYKCHERACNFNELISMHKKYGWPEYPTNTKLTFDKLMAKVKRLETMEKDPERKGILTKIHQQMYKSLKK